MLHFLQLTFEELRRGEKRKVLMDRISLAGKASGLHFTKAMKAAIEAIHEVHFQYTCLYITSSHSVEYM